MIHWALKAYIKEKTRFQEVKEAERIAEGGRKHTKNEH